ncbi:hypothetical protein [Lysinibacillus sphaericus]|uniref:hypothetical protein n=1 Tax=Lysinibacillus sphaericus TaxID=1421 RepID=UPI0004DF3584|nr:hypothetical protein [Lysinibacillus sphaericus]QPA60654.1 hypothetical protein INQ55_10140 [Lysinibacillus sphaericus]
MDALEKLNQQINSEVALIEDLAIEIVMLAKKGETDIAQLRKQHLHNSLNQLEILHRQKWLWSAVETLNNNGTLQKAVDEYAHQA